MANRKISDLTALTAPAAGDLLPIVDISEALAVDKNKRITIEKLLQAIPVDVGIGTGGTAPVSRLQVVGTGTFGNGVGGRLQVTTDSNLGYIDSLNNTSTGWQPLLQRGTEIQFHTNTAGTTPTQKATIDSSGRLLVGGSSNSGGALLQVFGDRIRVGTAKTPASASATGAAGEICWDANYIYVCTATNTWKRTAIATW